MTVDEERRSRDRTQFALDVMDNLARQVEETIAELRRTISETREARTDGST